MGSILEKNSSAVRKRIEKHRFSDENGEEYDANGFGKFNDYVRRKKIKLQNLDAETRESSADKPQIFKGVVGHVMGYTQPPLSVIHKELVTHGAGFLQYLDSKTMATHIIASALPPKKVVDYNRYRIVRPQWITDSVDAGKMLPWTDYRLVDESGPRQKTIKFDGGKVSTQAKTPQSQGYKEQSRNSFYSQQLQYDSPLPASSHCSPDILVSPQDATGSSMQMDSPSKPPRESLPVAAFSQPPLLDPQPESNIQKREVSSEEHNKMLLSDPKIRQQSSANPSFLKQFYSESRLHHLSTWKAELKSKLQRMANESGLKQKVATKRKAGSRRYIMHVDFDSFFCAVSLKNAPEYVEKPAAVAHSTGTGSEIASCNYPARKFGVKNGMWMKKALELCPDIKVLPYDFPAYEEASRQFYEAILEVGGIVQSVSVDEALIDITAIATAAGHSDAVSGGADAIAIEQAKCDDIATVLRGEIKTRTGFKVSVGTGGNILLAKVALRKAKPDGQYQIKPEDIQPILDELKVEQLPGVAYSLGGKLEEMGVKVVKELRQVSKERLCSHLGPKKGEKLWEYARGLDKAEVGEQPPRKSVSAEVNWGIRFINQQEADEFVSNLCHELERRLLNEQVRGTTLTMKIMCRSPDAPLDPTKHLGHGKCDTFNKSISFGVATHSANVISKEAVSILRSFKLSPGDLRGLGVQLTKLEPIKHASSAAPDGSQRKLQFGPPGGKKTRDHIEESELRASTIGSRPGSAAGTRISRGGGMKSDPITDEPLTPKKPKSQRPIHPALALSRAGERDEKATTALNISGTQFIMPSNPDLAVLRELPPDIRSRLQAQGRKQTEEGSALLGATKASDKGGKPSLFSHAPRPISASDRLRPASSPTADAIPADIDMEVFAALPDDVKAELLASYRSASLARNRMTLPHSPKKSSGGIKDMIRKRQGRDVMRAQSASASPILAPILAPAVATAPSIAALPAVALSSHTDGEVAALTSTTLPQDQQMTTIGSSLDPVFLAELPNDEARREAIQQHEEFLHHNQNHHHHLHLLQAEAAAAAGAAEPDLIRPTIHDSEDTANKATATANNNNNNNNNNNKPSCSSTKTITFPTIPQKASFATTGAQDTNEIKNMLHVWHIGTLRDGPHTKDALVLERYLARVVGEERDVEKAVGLVRWLDWLVENGNGTGGEGEGGGGDRLGDVGKGKKKWRNVVESVKEVVRNAVGKRGLPRNVRF